MTSKTFADEYLDTVNRLEPDIHPIDASAFHASAAISLKRLADSAARMVELAKIQTLATVMMGDSVLSPDHRLALKHRIDGL